MRQPPRGFSLIEVMITLAIASGAMYVLMQVTQNHLKQQRMVNTDAELSTVVQLIQSSLASPTTCGDVVEHQPFNADKAVTTPIALSLPGGQPFGPGESPLLPNWKVRGVYVRAMDEGQILSAEYRLYTSSIDILFARKSAENSIGTELKTRTIPFTAMVNTVSRKIAGCNSAGSSGVTQGLTCAMLGGSFIDAKQVCRMPPMNSRRCAALGGDFTSGGCRLKLQDSVRCHALSGVYTPEPGECQIAALDDTDEGELRRCRISCKPAPLPMSVQCGTDELCLTSCAYEACEHELTIPVDEDTVVGGSTLLGACTGAGVAANSAIHDSMNKPLCPINRMCTATCRATP